MYYINVGRYLGEASVRKLGQFKGDGFFFLLNCIELHQCCR